MFFKSILIGSLLVIGINCTFYSRYDDPYETASLRFQQNHHNHHQKNAGWRRGGHQLARDTESLETAASSSASLEDELEREPLAPDYKDPIGSSETEVVPEVRSPRPTADTFFQSGVIDVDAGSFGLPSGFPDVPPDVFGFGGGFASKFPSHADAGGFFGGFGGLFGDLDAFKPWWKGENVCIEREETNEDDPTTSEDDDDEDDDLSNEGEKRKNSTNAVAKKDGNGHRPAYNFFSTSINLSSCHQTPNKYECITKINNHGLIKTLTVRYKCCYGFERSGGDDGRNANGCTRKLTLKPLLETIEENDGKEFTAMLRTAQLDARIKAENLTVFVPTDVSLNEFTEKMLEMNNIDIIEMVRRKRQTRNAVSSEELILNHLTKGFVDLNDLENEQILKSENDGASIRINIYPTPSNQRMLTANCARVTKGNNLASNGIVHVMDGVIVPALQTVQEIIGESARLTNLKTMLERTDFLKLLKDDGHYTIFAPTDAAFNKLDESTRQKLLKGDACALNVLRHHVIAHTVCTAAVIGNATTHNIDGVVVAMERKENDEIVIDEEARVTQSDVIATNGVVHLIDTVLIPASAQYVNQALKTHNLTKFQEYVERAGLVDAVNGYKNVTIFAPTNKAFDDDEAIAYLDAIAGDRDKLRAFVDYHTVDGQVKSCDLKDNDLLRARGSDGDDDDGGNRLRVNLYSTIPLFTNIVNAATVNCARIRNYDEESCGSTIHAVDKILVPPTRSVLETVKNDANYTTLMKIVAGTEMERLLDDKTRSITLLAPDDEAFAKIDEKDLKLLMEDKEKANAVLKNHVLPEVLCCSGVGPHPYGFNNLVKTLSNQLQPITRRNDHHIRIGRATLLKCDTIATNGILHRVDKIMFPHSRHEPTFGLFLFDF